MQITHEEAHRLIQFHADGELKIQQKRLLASHLEDCATCRQYASSMEKMESALRPLLHQNWDREHLPLSIVALTAKGKDRGPERLLLATRIAAFAVVFLAFFFSAWNFSISSRRTPTPFLQGVPVIPTPLTSTMTAGTEIGFENCTMSSYLVQENDTLASIAYRFSVPMEYIGRINSMQNETVIIGQMLLVPICNSTATNPTAAHTITFTPIVYSTPITPDG